MGTPEGQHAEPAAETGYTMVFEFPYRHSEADVRATLRIRWERDPAAGLETAWWASFNRPPWRLDGQIPGLMPVGELTEIVADRHRRSKAPRGSLT